jgi:putative endonuclease
LISGADAETRALRHLEAQGLKLVTRNWRTTGGELDLVLRDRDTLVIAEVRARSRSDFGGAAASVDSRKRARIVHAARAYLAGHPQFARLAVRFDVVALEGGGIEWIQNAFDVED